MSATIFGALFIDVAKDFDLIIVMLLIYIKVMFFTLHDMINPVIFMAIDLLI